MVLALAVPTTSAGTSSMEVLQFVKKKKKAGSAIKQVPGRSTQVWGPVQLRFNTHLKGAFFLVATLVNKED